MGASIFASPNATSQLNYFSPPIDGSIPYDRVYADLTGTVPLTNSVRVKKHTPLHDLRALVNQGRESETNVQVTGFQVLGRETAKTSMKEEDFTNDELIRSKYYEETIALLKKSTGASKVIIFDHTIRRAVDPKAAYVEETPETRAPVPFVHVDQTPASGERRVRRHAANEAEAEQLLSHRASLINVWRPLRPVGSSPLAFADARTLNKETDLVPSRLLYAPPTPEGETFSVAFNPEHKWFYLNEMIPDEAVLLQCWSNRGDGITPHTGTTLDNYVGDNNQPRQSIEVRALCFFDD